jgi:hypothetical protein
LAIEIQRFSLFPKKNSKYLGVSITNQIVGITIFSKNTGKSISYSFLDKGAQGFAPGGVPGDCINAPQTGRLRRPG